MRRWLVRDAGVRQGGIIILWHYIANPGPDVSYSRGVSGFVAGKCGGRVKDGLTSRATSSTPNGITRFRPGRRHEAVIVGRRLSSTFRIFGEATFGLHTWISWPDGISARSVQCRDSHKFRAEPGALAAVPHASPCRSRGYLAGRGMAGPSRKMRKVELRANFFPRTAAIDPPLRGRIDRGCAREALAGTLSRQIVSYCPTVGATENVSHTDIGTLPSLPRLATRLARLSAFLAKKFSASTRGFPGRPEFPRSRSNTGTSINSGRRRARWPQSRTPPIAGVGDIWRAAA
jgi:hypothetical protein